MCFRVRAGTIDSIGRWMMYVYLERKVAVQMCTLVIGHHICSVVNGNIYTGRTDLFIVVSLCAFFLLGLNMAEFDWAAFDSFDVESTESVVSEEESVKEDEVGDDVGGGSVEGSSPVATPVSVDDGEGKVKEDEGGELEGKGKRKGIRKKKGEFELNAAYVFVTWVRSSITDHLEFYERLKAKMPNGTMMYGSKELHMDGTPHYHVLLKFPKRKHITNARSYFQIEDEPVGVHFQTYRPGEQTARDFVAGVEAYCAKDDNPCVFGESIDVEVGRDAQKKRIFREIDEEEDYDEAKRMIREADPMRFMFGYTSVIRYLGAEKRRKIDPSKYRAVTRDWWNEWNESETMIKWREQNVFCRGPGRATSLVLVGKGRTGKTSWATSFGVPLEMSKRWNLKSCAEGFSHIVVNDVNPMDFGSSGQTYWREVLGCQESFDATDKYCETVRLRWDLPCIWTCNYDDDPRQFKDIRQYMEDCGVVVVEIDKPLWKSGVEKVDC